MTFETKRIIEQLEAYLVELESDIDSEENLIKRHDIEIIASGVGQALNIVRNGHPYIV